MNEIKFLHKNIRKWEEFDALLENRQQSMPDNISDLYIKLTDDLSYSRTYFPQSEATTYLNLLTQKAHDALYQNKSNSFGKILAFWRYDFPALVFECRKELLVSFVIFMTSVLIGWISNTHDSTFVRTIMGDSYVNMTLHNIEKGDPMAVYKKMNEMPMFLGITINNVKVSFIVFVFGIFSALGPGFMLFRNGVMLGAFQGFMVSKGLALESVATIWIHGTLEIWAIIVAGAAGIVIGNSIVFPKSYSRIASFRKGITKGGKIIIGLVPIFVIAGFLEGFVTRHTDIHYAVRFGIIGASALFIIFYFIIYPYYKTRSNHGTKQY